MPCQATVRIRLSCVDTRPATRSVPNLIQFLPLLTSDSPISGVEATYVWANGYSGILTQIAHSDKDGLATVVVQENPFVNQCKYCIVCSCYTKHGAQRTRHWRSAAGGGHPLTHSASTAGQTTTAAHDTTRHDTTNMTKIHRCPS